jgi:cytochrome c6
LDAIVSLVTLGKGNMSAYGDRMTPEEIQTVSAYVLAQADRNWKSD